MAERKGKGGRVTVILVRGCDEFRNPHVRRARLTDSTEALAVLGAELRLRRDAVSGDARLRELLTRVATAVEPSLLDGLDAAQESIAHAAIETSFRQAADLLERPARPPGWFY
jgi:hypothetical protein